MADTSTTQTSSEPELIDMLARDGAIAVGALAAWGGAEAWAASSEFGLAMATTLAAAVIAGWLIPSIAHEWGHYLGAKLTRAKAPRVRIPNFLFVRFNFDLESNSLGQFTSMSIGGSVVHWGVFLAALMLIPMDTLGQFAFVSATFAFAVYGSAVEWPIIARTTFGKVAPKNAFAGLSFKSLRMYQALGAIAGIGFFAWV